LFSGVDVAARYGHCQTLRGSTLFTVGGLCAEGAPPAPEVLRYDVSENCWLQPMPLGIAKCNENPKNAVVYKGMTFAASASNDHFFFVFGGRSNSYTDKLYKLHLSTGEWELLPEGSPADSPSPRYGSSMVLFENRLYVFGGYTANGMASDEVLCYDLTARSWAPVNFRIAQ